ncbi:MAG: hypothetical protein KBG60_07455 [Anaerolineaceae bacterium]|nr:hypothetical protein [Anaerolineaceae bacterium]
MEPKLDPDTRVKKRITTIISTASFNFINAFTLGESVVIFKVSTRKRPKFQSRVTASAMMKSP